MSDEIAVLDEDTSEETVASPFLAWWWKIVDFKIGIVPLPVFIGLLGLILAFVRTGKVPSDILTNMAVLAVGGFRTARNWASVCH